MKTEKHKRSRQPALVVMILSWLIPGYGFYHHGLKKRAIFFFVSLELTFLIGVMMQASVLVPDFWPTEGDPTDGFNLVTILTFLTQIFNGLPALISMLPDITFFGPKFAILPYNETYAWSDLGSFYLLVSGGMNYFVLVNTWDHFYGRKAAGATQAAERDLTREETA